LIYMNVYKTDHSDLGMAFQYNHSNT
jgi:hypothetical protein